MGIVFPELQVESWVSKTIKDKQIKPLPWARLWGYNREDKTLSLRGLTVLPGGRHQIGKNTMGKGGLWLGEWKAGSQCAPRWDEPVYFSRVQGGTAVADTMLVWLLH